MVASGNMCVLVFFHVDASMMQSKGARDATFTRPQPSSSCKVPIAVASHS